MPRRMIKGPVHLKIPFFSPLSFRLQSPQTSYTICLTKKKKKKKAPLRGCSQQQTEWCKLAANTKLIIPQLDWQTICLQKFFLYFFLLSLSCWVAVCCWRWQHSESAWTFQPLLWSLTSRCLSWYLLKAHTYAVCAILNFTQVFNISPFLFSSKLDFFPETGLAKPI